jgi:hypothetical protein
VARHYHAREIEPRASVPSPSRIRAAIARIVRVHAGACSLIPSVFGFEVVDVLTARVTRLATAYDDDIVKNAEALHGLLVWLAAVAECVELESPAAAQLVADLNSILRNCELIATGTAALERQDVTDDVATESPADDVQPVELAIDDDEPARKRVRRVNDDETEVADWRSEL